MKKFLTYISSIRLIFHLIFILTPLHTSEIIRLDIRRWAEILRISGGDCYVFCFLMTWFPEYRNLFYARIGRISCFIRFLAPRMSTLYITTESIGPGLFIQHGFATIISARSIGTNCWINQQVTIGYSTHGAPVIGDRVLISAGAKVIGDIKVGDNSIVGANAVVVKSVPGSCTVAGVPACIIRKNGVKTHMPL